MNGILVYTSTHGGSELVNGGFDLAMVFGLKDYKIDNGANVGMTVDAIKFVQKLTTERTFKAV